METTSLIPLVKNAVPKGYSDSTGMNVYSSFMSSSGFNYFVGAREAGDILIVEKVAEGTACTYLCGILIFSKIKNVLIKEINVPLKTHYSREFVVRTVKENLMEILVESAQIEGEDIDVEAAEQYVYNLLDKCYFEKSRKAILEWAKDVGIIK